MNVQKNTKEGFTIIEVVLVLAIAGLIFLMIFIAWPALQRSQRDTARKNDLNTVASAVASYRSNNRGNNPTGAASLNAYIDNLGQYPKSSADWPITFGTPPTTANTTTIYIENGKKCNPSGAGVVAGTTRQSAVESFTENGVLVCQDA